MTKKRSRSLRSLLGNAAFFLNLLTVIWLGGCYLASHTSPLQQPYLALLSLTTPFAILVNLLFAVFWLFTRRKWRLLFPVAALVLTHNLVSAIYGLHYASINQTDSLPGTLKVMTWNVHGLGIYDRPANKKAAEQILEYIWAESPDILCLPEFYTDWDDATKPYSKRFLREGRYKEYRFIYDNTLGTKIYVGTAFYSKYPLRNLQEVQLARYIKLMQCDVELPGKRIMRTCFIHLQSFMLLDKDKQLIEEVKNRERNLDASRSMTFVNRFRTAYEKRAVQADSAAAIIARSPYPVLICGDLNDLPGSYTYTTIKGKLNDAFAEKGRGLGRTYNQILPTLRIDYILYDPSLLRIIGFRSPRTQLSDHNPVIANFQLLPAPES